MMIATSLRTGALVALSLLALIHCGGDQKAAEVPATMPSAEPPSDQAPQLDAGTAQTPATADVAPAAEASKPPEPKPETLSDAQIAAITDAANSAEIAQAKIAQVKSKDAGVKAFAAMMIVHHGEAKQKQAKLKLKTEESGVSTAMHADAGATLDALRTECGQAIRPTLHPRADRRTPKGVGHHQRQAAAEREGSEFEGLLAGAQTQSRGAPEASETAAAELG